ncbi:hypothetical protein RvY_17320 [Ramazzottius varieornatus]|uniref:Uncharacterized protein n=1 Tax=Ramazzottius varieornatus TaxID=947166 RepID=A0A1D1W3Y9_RAMVA|nr:hypothetical protein RvY_17320 [Ramazzottius varieornatus]
MASYALMDYAPRLISSVGCSVKIAKNHASGFISFGTPKRAKQTRSSIARAIHTVQYPSKSLKNGREGVVGRNGGMCR